MKKSTRSIKIKTKILIPVVLTNILICCILIFTICNRMELSMIKLGKTQSQLTAKLAASNIDGDLLQKIAPGSEGTSDYNKIKDTMYSSLTDTDISYLYTLYTYKDKVYYSIVTEAEDDELTVIGEEYDDSYDYLQQVFTGSSFTEDEVDDTKYGLFITSYVPIFNSAGEVISILGCDYDASTIKNTINRYNDSNYIRSDMHCYINFVMYNNT